MRQEHTIYRTVNNTSQAEIVEKKSRFIAALAHAETEESALGFLAGVRSEHRMARHHVYAYVLRESGRVRYSDDGEPQKTAGLPTLEVIQHAGLFDVVMVTTRYFGGVLLGTGGLVRAYTGAAQAALEKAQIVEISRCVDVIVHTEYGYYEQALRIAEQYGAQVKDSSFEETVTISLLMQAGTEQSLGEAMAELTHGTAQIKIGDIYDTAF